MKKSEYDLHMLGCVEAFATKKWEKALSLVSALLRRDLSTEQRRELYGFRGSINLAMGESALALKDLQRAIRIVGGTSFSDFSLALACAEAQRNLNSLDGERKYLQLAIQYASQDPNICIAGCVRRLIDISRNQGSSFSLTPLQETALIQNWRYFELEGTPGIEDLDATLAELIAAEDRANMRARLRNSED